MKKSVIMEFPAVKIITLKLNQNLSFDVKVMFNGANFTLTPDILDFEFDFNWGIYPIVKILRKC